MQMEHLGWPAEMGEAAGCTDGTLGPRLHPHVGNRFLNKNAKFAALCHQIPRPKNRMGEGAQWGSASWGLETGQTSRHRPQDCGKRGT